MEKKMFGPRKNLSALYFSVEDLRLHYGACQYTQGPDCVFKILESSRRCALLRMWRRQASTTESSPFASNHHVVVNYLHSMAL
jgi:hypothetical protein